MKKHIPSFLLYGAAVFQSIQFAIAGNTYFGWAGILTGLFGGAIINFCISLAASRISDVAKKRRGLSYTGLGVLLLVSPGMVGPALFLWANRAISLPFAVAVSVLWAIAPDIAILTAGAITGKGMFGALATEQTVAVSHPAKKASKEASPEMLKRATCERLRSEYSCLQPGCVWKPLVETLMQSGNPERSAKNARTAHNMHKHPAAIRVEMEAK